MFLIPSAAASTTCWSSEDNVSTSTVTPPTDTNASMCSFVPALEEETVKRMEGLLVSSYPLKRNTKVRTFASAKVVKVSEDRTMLSQRFLVVYQSGDFRLDPVIDYELCPYPLSLFEAKYFMCKANKRPLAEAIRNSASVELDRGT
ncbi:hypothetical protein Hamer_G015550 [Homarus americanus]|uniref:Uncharacterized protein n=1 Tax=Homarus americanus TaxID=6706 RepID=A0A8J5NA12_HOMAM|nr:hypothetical protein Hamer_G015550 [Homarus americanus]